MMLRVTMLSHTELGIRLDGHTVKSISSSSIAGMNYECMVVVGYVDRSQSLCLNVVSEWCALNKKRKIDDRKKRVKKKWCNCIIWQH